MQFLNIFLSSVGSIIVLFLLTKLIGNKEMSQLSMFDYVNSITIGSIAAEMATGHGHIRRRSPADFHLFHELHQIPAAGRRKGAGFIGKRQNLYGKFKTGAH